MLFTSEAVSEGHPDKICDQIADAILDAYIERDPFAKVACEVVCCTGMVLIFGEITSTVSDINHQQIARNVIKDIGYIDAKMGFDYKTCSVIVNLVNQSSEIASGVHVNKDELRAGDSGLMFGYATNETDELMPASLVYARNINLLLHKLRRYELDDFDWLRPDSKTQVTLEYDEKFKPKMVHTVVVSVQHSPDVDLDHLRQRIRDDVVKKVLPEEMVDENTLFHINPAGSFIMGGPFCDSGLTGRKIIVDTYGGWGAHGGGSFSGKDPSKVDRSGAYAARWVAKSLVKSKLCERCLVQISYAIGIAKPISISVTSYGTSKLTDLGLTDIVKQNFDLQPSSIIENLKLYKPIYRETSKNGHFGHSQFPWEQ